MAPPIEPHLRLEKDDRELQVRPARLVDFVGQRDIAENLAAYLKAALVRQEPLDHVLLSARLASEKRRSRELLPMKRVRDFRKLPRRTSSAGRSCENSQWPWRTRCAVHR